MVTAASIAHTARITSGLPITPEHVTLTRTGGKVTGYGISGLSRDDALELAAHALGAFREDPEAGLPGIRVCTGWRGTDGHTVRVSHDPR